MAGTQRFSHLAGHPALDLANTVRWRLDEGRRGDTLRSFGDVMEWAREFELLTPAELHTLEATADPDESAAELERVASLREAIHAVVVDPGSAAELVAAAYTEAINAATLTASGSAWSWTLPADSRLPRLRIALLAVDLLTTRDRTRFRQCDDDHCGWVFADDSPRHNRRWCSSTDCGNRNRVRAHYDRVRAT